MLAAFKLRAVPINVNYRYVEDELRYLLDDADAVAVVFHREFAPKLAAIRPSLPAAADVHRRRRRHRDADAPTHRRRSTTRRALAAGIAGARLRAALAPTTSTSSTPAAPPACRRASCGATRTCSSARWAAPAAAARRSRTPEEIAERCREPRTRCVPVVPVHARHRALDGVQRAVHRRARSSSPPSTASTRSRCGELVEREQANFIVIVGDAFARPLLDALDTPDGPRARRVVPARRAVGRRDPLAVAEARARRAPARRARRRRLRRVGDRRPGPVGRRRGRRRPDRAALPRRRRHAGARRRSPTRSAPAWSAGSPGAATSRSATTRTRRRPRRRFPVVDGVRWAVPGDHAVVEADGTITLLGRGSVSINTGGEKVYPEEVESVLKAHADVFDAVVVGVPDERWGERVVAVVQPRAGAAPRSTRCSSTPRAHLAGYKVPREVVLVDAIERSPSGKPDYRWATGGSATTARRVRSRRDREPPRRRDQPVPPPARRQPRRLVPVGRRGVRARPRRRRADLPVGRLLVVPLVPRDGARVVRGRRRPPRS